MEEIQNLDKKYLEKKAWGWKYSIMHNNFFAIDVLYMQKGGYTSWHYHKFKYNRLFLLSGSLEIKLKKIPLADYYNLERYEQAEDIYYLDLVTGKRLMDITPTIHHRIFALEDSVVIEVDSVRCLKTDIFREDIGGILT